VRKGGAVRRTVCIILLAVIGAACNNAADVAPQASGSVTYPVTISAANGSVTIPKKPLRIVSLSATATEILFAIGAGSQVVAVDDQSNYPAEAPKTKLSGYEPNIEAIASYTPDVVSGKAQDPRFAAARSDGAGRQLR
jgi:cobalamin transport system substrate-binding protein